MKLILEKEEALTIIHSALCNGGLSELSAAGVELAISGNTYPDARAQLLEKDPSVKLCCEDVWTQILRSGKALEFYDHEGEEEISFTLDKAIEELSKEEALDVVNTYKEEQDDAYTGFELLQLCLYGEVIFG